MSISRIVLLAMLSLALLLAACESDSPSSPTPPPEDKTAVESTPEASSGSAAAPQEDAPAPPADETPTLAFQLDTLKAKFLASAPEDRIRIYEEGIEAVRRAGIAEKSLEVGQQAPDFTLPDAQGGERTLSKVLEDGPAVLVWYRGGWCPYCRIELAAFQKVLPEIEALGATVLAIAPELPAKTRETAKKLELTYPVLSDQGNKVAAEYGLVYTLPEPVQAEFAGRLDLAGYNGDDSAQLPISATYVIDTDGKVRFAVADPDYRTRAEPADIVATLEAMSGG